MNTSEYDLPHGMEIQGRNRILEVGHTTEIDHNFHGNSPFVQLKPIRQEAFYLCTRHIKIFERK